MGRQQNPPLAPCPPADRFGSLLDLPYDASDLALGARDILGRPPARGPLGGDPLGAYRVGQVMTMQAQLPQAQRSRLLSIRLAGKRASLPLLLERGQQALLRLLGSC